MVFAFGTDAGPAYADVQQLAGLFPCLQAAEHGGGGVEIGAQAEEGPVVPDPAKHQLLHRPNIVGQGGDGALHLDGFAFMVTVSPNPHPQGLAVLGEDGLGI